MTGALTFTLGDILTKLCRREDLTQDESRWVFEHITSGQAAEAQIGGLLVGLAAKGTTVEELVGAASVLRERVIPIDCPGNDVLLDTCGTGGDVRHTFNISTAAAILAAACGVTVVKHGNRSASGRTGSADVLEALGVRLDVMPATLTACLAQANLCFAFARAHHPAVAHVAAARKALGIPTIFNILAPLANPGRAKHQLLGVFAPELTDRLASVLRELGSVRAWVVHAEDGLDELSTLGPTRISELRDGHIQTWTLDPAELDIPYARLSDLQITDTRDSAEKMGRLLAGEPGALRDISALNAAAALVIAGRAADLRAALSTVNAAIDDGRAKRTLQTLVRLTNS